DATPDVRYFYDAQTLPTGAPIFTRGASTGRLVAVTTGGTNAGTYYGYDGLGRVLRRIQRTDSINYLSEATYNKAGGMLAETYPAVPGHTNRRTVSYDYDGAGRLRSLSAAGTTYSLHGASASNVTYAPHGGLSSETLGNNLVHGLTYNSRLQPTQIKLGTSATPTSVLNLTYNYGTSANNGNLLDVTEKIGTWTAKQVYTYDDLNRLDKTEENNGTTATPFWTEDNEYDRFGNRWEVVGGVPSLTFNNKNRVIGYVYDAVGNVLSDDTSHTYAYDAENRINAVDGVANTYVYDGEGKRVRKYFPLGEQVRFVYGVGGRLLMEFDAANSTLKKEYVYGANGLLATVDPADGTRYVTADHFGSPRVLTSDTGTVASRHDYKPFGQELADSVSGRTQAQGFGVDDELRHKFTEKERDSETGLDYFGARYYASSVGRFTSTDPMGIKSRHLLDPQDLNRYSYVSNNPLKFIDPDGKEKIKVIIRTFIPGKTVKAPDVSETTFQDSQRGIIRGKIRTFEGDNRKAGEHPERFRTQHTIIIETDPSKNGGRPVYSDEARTGPTREILPNGEKREAQATGDTMKLAEASYAQGHPNTVAIRAYGDEPNPLVPGSPGISYDFTIVVRASGPGDSATVAILGEHDGFPGYEIAIVRPETGNESETIITSHNPDDEWETPFSLLPPMEWSVIFFKEVPGNEQK
ncbi:MAG TPA: RHS repeat-associated core domain-containing protein, partial [Pyrinomonadaceae bacterium]|nr:RHS repeat-associated core domain-containing protein [Pyrinomonadaceae bacterium]